MWNTGKYCGKNKYVLKAYLSTVKIIKLFSFNLYGFFFILEKAWFRISKYVVMFSNFAANETTTKNKILSILVLTMSYLYL